MMGSTREMTSPRLNTDLLNRYRSRSRRYATYNAHLPPGRGLDCAAWAIELQGVEPHRGFAPTPNFIAIQFASCHGVSTRAKKCSGHRFRAQG